MQFKDVIRENARQIALLSRSDMKSLLPVLNQARETTARGLSDWLRKENREGRYTTATHRQLLSSIDESIRLMKRQLGGAMAADLQTEARGAALKSLIAMRKSAIAGAQKFEDSAIPLRFRNAQIAMSTTESLMRRHAGSALRYAGRQGDDIQRQLAVGIVRGESIGQTVSRLMKKPMILSETMSDSEVGDAVAERMFFRSRADAERLVRTENVHAANKVQMDALMDDNDDADETDDADTKTDDGGDGDGGDGDEGDDESRGEGGWLLRWDATFDMRTCERCEMLDGEIRAPGEEFEEGCLHPPLHPNCRCAVTPWREGWEL